jgi:hypothetical protein
MKMPGFTAEAALYRKHQFYSAKGRYRSQEASRVVPQASVGQLCADWCIACGFDMPFLCPSCFMCLGALTAEV